MVKEDVRMIAGHQMQWETRLGGSSVTQDTNMLRAVITMTPTTNASSS